MADLLNHARILRSWVDQILAAENNDDRFEDFANEVVSILEGKTIVGTSKSWDAGRDGRGLGPAHGIFVLTTLRTDVKKPKTDAARLKSIASKIRHVYYVAPRLVSDKVLEEHCVVGLEVPFGIEVPSSNHLRTHEVVDDGGRTVGMPMGDARLGVTRNRAAEARDAPHRAPPFRSIPLPRPASPLMRV